MRLADYLPAKALDICLRAVKNGRVLLKRLLTSGSLNFLNSNQNHALPSSIFSLRSMICHPFCKLFPTCRT